MQRRIVSKTLESEKIEVPLAIQTGYLWRQTSVFLKSGGNERKAYGPACIAFEKIICDNLVGDLQSNLSSAMATIPRWHFVQGALPFVLHCCEALLANRFQSGTIDQLSVAEGRLLYTLQWILMKAPEEIENYADKLHPLSTVELFVQSIVPYVSCIQHEDLTLRLQDGIDIWKALWEYKAPPLKSFTASVVLNAEGANKASGSSRGSYPAEEIKDRATFFDLAVLKCLMMPDWREEGRFWGLQYVLKFLENEIAEEANELANQSTQLPDVKDESEKPPKIGMAHLGSSLSKVDKLKRYYGFTTQQEGSSSDKRRLSLKDSFRRIRNVSTTSSSSLFDNSMSNLKLLDMDENNVEVANGAKEFLEESGCVKRKVFLDVIFQIASQSTSARVFDAVLSVLLLILENYVTKNTVSEAPRNESTETASFDHDHSSTLTVGYPADRIISEPKQPIGKMFSSTKLSFYSTFNKALICVISVVRALGCSYGCGKGIRGVAGKNLRAKAMAMLTKLHATEPIAFTTCLTKYFEDEDVEKVTDFLHALLGFCTMTLESKSNQASGDLFKEKGGTLGMIVDCVFGTYVAKLLEFNLEEISNVTLYGQLRQLVKYVKEYCGGTFYRVVFAGLLKSTGKPEKRLQGGATEPKVPQAMVDTESLSTSKSVTTEKIVTPKNSRKLFFTKFSRSGSSTDGSPTGNVEFGFDTPTTPLSRKKGLRKNFKKGSAFEESFAVDDELTPTNSLDRRRKSLRKFFQKSNRKKVDEIFSSEMKKTSASSLTSLRRRQQRPSVAEYTSIPVKVKEVRDGMMMFSMLLESSIPGSVPDAQIIAGILELKAPVVARGALLLECAHFVHRCNIGQWPSWLLSSHPSTRRGKGGFGALVRNAIAVSRRNVRIKHEAGLLFYKWAVAIGEKLEQIELRKPSSHESKDGTEATKHIEEDFLDEGTLDEEARKCPHALKMVACQLLLEITAFLRESHGSLAAKAENQRQRNKSIAFSRGNRRLTQKIPAYSGMPEQRDAVTSGPAERLRHVSLAMLSPVITLSIPQTCKGGEGEKQDGKVTAPVIKVDPSPKDSEDAKTTTNRKRFSALFLNSEKKRKIMKTEPTDRKATVAAASRLYKKSPRAHKALGRVTSDVSDISDNEEDEVTKFPWLKAVAIVMGSTNFLCDHREACPLPCIRRQIQNCAKFLSAIKTIYVQPVSQLTQHKHKKSESDKGRQCKLSTKELTIKEKKARDKVMITYIGEEVRNLFNCPMSVLMKGAVVLEPSLMLDIIPLAWELLLSPLEELVSTAAAVFLVASLHLKDEVEKLLRKELTCDSCEEQVKSLMRYGVLWRSRYHVWPRMEAGAKFVLKIPLPKLDFTLPSPPVGSCAPPVPDCPWDPKSSMHMTKNEQELTEEDKKKDKEEATKLKEEKKKQRTEYTFTNTSVSLESSAPVEPEEGVELSIQAVTTDFWPPAMCSAVSHIISLLDDTSVTQTQTAVSEMAKRILWGCLVDDPTLFFRTFFEEVTTASKQTELVFLLNKLLVHIPYLPPNAGTILFNHLVGVILYYSRRSQPCSEDAIALLLSALIWKIVPSVPNLYLKDLKYSAKKEHCERTLMITANTPGTKKIVITCPHLDERCDNEKVTVREDMTFDHVLQYCTAKWSLDSPLYRLIDAKSGKILEGKHLVRDIYAFKKGFPYPQLKIELYDEYESYVKRQEQAFTSKLAEIGRLALTNSILEAVQSWHHVSFLHSELSKQNAFPRKALDVDFGLYEGGVQGLQLCAVDAIHKRIWVKLLSKLFDSMNTSFPWGEDDLHLFLNVINGTLLLQCEDSSMLRFCLSTLINTAVKFSDIFAIDGYQHILPTLVLLYSHHESNAIVCRAVEFVLSQFYCLHQKPFLLQLFASIEPILLTGNVNKMPEHSDDMDESNMIHPKCLFKIVSSLEKDAPDSLDILALVDAAKPLKPLDSCYEGKLDGENQCKIDIAIRLCVTVVACSPESVRATQMLVILSSILPEYLQYVRNNCENVDKKQCKDELTVLSSLLCSVQVLLKSCNALRRPFLKNKGLNAAKKRTREGSTGSMTSLTTSHENLRQSKVFSDDEDKDVDSIDQQFKPFLNKFSTQDEGEQVLDSLYEFRTPRNAILMIASEFISTSKNRLDEINRKNPSQHADLSLDGESILMLCNIAHTLLKLALTDTVSLESPGLQRFMLEALPNIEWCDELQAPLNLVLKRINITFSKITDKPDLMNFFWPYPLLLHRSENWNVSVVLLKGLYLTISRHHVVAAYPYTKAIVATCMRLILREQDEEAEAANMFNTTPPPSVSFCQISIKLAARLMFCLKDKYSLKDLCGGTVEFGNEDRTHRVLVHLLLPLCIRLGTGNKDEPRATKDDISYATSCLLNIIVTPLVSGSTSARRLSNAIAVDKVIDNSPPSFVQRVIPRKSDTSVFSATIHNAAYLGLKIIIVCFPDFLSSDWPTIAAVFKEVVLANVDNDALWDFLDFIVLQRTPLFLLLLPIIRTKIPELYCSSARAKGIKEKVLNNLTNPPHPTPSKDTWMKQFIEGLSVCTGTARNDMFMCRNPTQPSAVMIGGSSDVESISDFDEAMIQPSSDDVFEQKRKESVSSSGLYPPAVVDDDATATTATINEDKVNQTMTSKKALKKRVSFDNSGPHDNVEATFDPELRPTDRPPHASKHKRSLPRQEVAVDIESPITFRRPSVDLSKPQAPEVYAEEEYKDTVDSNYLNADGGMQAGKKRRLGKNRKPVHQTSIHDAIIYPGEELEEEDAYPTEAVIDVETTTDISYCEETTETIVSSEATLNLMENTTTSTVMKIKVFTEEGEQSTVEVCGKQEYSSHTEVSSSEDGSTVLLLPRPDEDGLHDVLEEAKVPPWARTKLEKSKETNL